MPLTYKPRLFCYVDETGQDTLGRFFIVPVVVTGDPRERLVAKLEQIEHVSHKPSEMDCFSTIRTTRTARAILSVLDRTGVNVSLMASRSRVLGSRGCMRNLIPPKCS